MVRRNHAPRGGGRGPTPLVILEAIRWRKGTIAIWTAVGLALAAAALLSSHPQYTATSQLLLGVSSAASDTDSAALVASEVETLKSKRLAQAAIDKLGLWNDPEFACGASAEFGAFSNLSRDRCGVSAMSPADRDAVMQRFKDATSVTRSGESFLVDVSFTSGDAQKAAAIANALATAYIEYRNGAQTRDVEQTGARLADHIVRAREKSDAASSAVDKLKSRDARAQVPPGDDVRTLQSESRAYDSIYQTLVARYAQSVHEQAAPITEAQLISEAQPPGHWSSPHVPLILLLGSSAGFLIGMASAMRKEFVARPIRSLEQIERDIGVPALGIVPLVEGRRLLPAAHQASPLLLRDRGDALRGIRIAVNEICARDNNVIGIVSAYQGEGKSTVAFNLAVLEVESHKRVLLVDANLHRPSLGRSLPHGTLLPPLEGRVTLADSVTRSELGFDFLGECVPEPPVHPAVLLGSPAMRGLIGAARDHYDCIVCDLPNVLGHADVQAAADIFDALVLVTEWGRTPSAAATRAALKSDVIFDRLAGVIINKAPLNHSVRI